MAQKVERLVNLTIALLEARRPVSFDDLRRRTGYYGQVDGDVAGGAERSQHARREASARRMFERDKDELRSLGVPITTRYDSLSGEAGYVVDRRAYELPDVNLDRDEMAALAVALRVTGQAHERLALSKLAARAPDPLALPSTVDARVSLETHVVDDIADAVVGRQAVRFTYRTGAGEESERNLDPYGVVLRRGTWYVVGHDHDRQALRSFRLDRVLGRIEPIGEPGAFDLPDDVDLAGHVTGPSSATVDVELAVTPAARWAAEARGGRVVDELADGRAVVRIEQADPWRMESWILGFGPDVEVLAPEDLRGAVIERLRAMVEQPS